MASEKKCQAHCTPTAFGWTRVRSAERTTRGRLAIIVGPLGLSHEEAAGVAPQPAARPARIGAMVGCSDVQLARDAVG